MRTITSTMLMILSIVFSHISAVTWEDHWTHAVELSEDKEYVESLNEFTHAIEMIESSGTVACSHVYVDRSRVLCLMNRHLEALDDVNVALADVSLVGNDLHQALLTRMHIYAVLGDEEKLLVDHNNFVNIYPGMPKTEFSKDRVIIRNVPQSSCYKSKITKILLNSGMCEREEDIKWMESSICIAKLKECHCGCDKKVLSAESECCWWCDKSKTASMLFCGKNMKSWGCYAICTGVVEFMADACNWCCSGGNYYQNCLKPFDNLLQRIGQGCDPAFN